MKKDNHRISKIGRDSSNTVMMMMKSSNNTSKTNSLSYLYNNSNFSQTSYEEQEEYNMVNAFSWPPRSYTCSFCKREFRSAQALGGHMNVHRKDRARLRQSPPSDVVIHGLYGHSTLLNLNLNPNPSLNMITTNTNNSQPPPLSYISTHKNDVVSSKKWPGTQVNHHHHHHSDLTGHINGSDLKVTKSQKLEGFAKSLKKKIIETPNAAAVQLDLEIGLVCDDKSEVGLDLDLELRLGYSN